MQLKTTHGDALISTPPEARKKSDKQDMNNHPPAAISPQAQAFLDKGDMTASHSLDTMTMTEIRAAGLEAYRPACEEAIKRHGITSVETEIGGVACMEVLPGDRTPGRDILYIFGGGFMVGSPFEELPITAFLAARLGARIICPYYRLAPEHPFPAALDDVSAVADSLFADNPTTLLAGESAGGNLALALVHRRRREGKSVPQAIAALSPATDLSHSGDSADADRDPFLLAARIPEVRAAYIPNHDPTNPEISPIYGSFDANFPPTLMTTGTRDMLLSGCVRLARVMREAGAAVDLRVWEGMWHVFEFYPDIPEAGASLTEISDFLNSHF